MKGRELGAIPTVNVQTTGQARINLGRPLTSPGAKRHDSAARRTYRSLNRNPKDCRSSIQLTVANRTPVEGNITLKAHHRNVVKRNVPVAHLPCPY